jgi:hypothetical protein
LLGASIKVRCLLFAFSEQALTLLSCVDNIAVGGTMNKRERSEYAKKLSELGAAKGGRA